MISKPWSFALLGVLTACGGASAPPPPVAVASASPSADDLRPLSSRDDADATVATAERKGTAAVSGTLAVAPGLPLATTDVLYVIAKRGASTIAVRRIDSPHFPLAFQISGDDVMTGGIAFEGPIDLVARISKSGDAIASKGDLEGTVRGVAVPSEGVSLTIDSTRS